MVSYIRLYRRNVGCKWYKVLGFMGIPYYTRKKPLDWTKIIRKIKYK